MSLAAPFSCLPHSFFLRTFIASFSLRLTPTNVLPCLLPSFFHLASEFFLCGALNECLLLPRGCMAPPLFSFSFIILPSPFFPLSCDLFFFTRRKREVFCLTLEQADVSVGSSVEVTLSFILTFFFFFEITLHSDPVFFLFFWLKGVRSPPPPPKSYVCSTREKHSPLRGLPHLLRWFPLPPFFDSADSV